MTKEERSVYFKSSSPFWMTTITLAFGYFTLVVFIPEKIPFEHLGPFGNFCAFLVKNYAEWMYIGWWVTVAIHVFEACVALSLCSKKGITNPSTRMLWFFQTFLFGYASLGLLLDYNRKRHKHM